ncbi:unnamed protein product [Auanema sp. JU1783]|nr:unnamed protein product [Auanema sp. JU1783]
MTSPDLRVWLLVIFSITCSVTSQSDYEQFQEFITTESERGLFPNIFNLATNSLINATSTCGQTHREEYCKLVEHVLLRKTYQEDSPQCDICDANDVRHRHPIEFAIDGTRRWWQSPSLANGLEFEKNNITIDLRQEYQVAYIIIKMGNSPRPGTWVLEKSLNGVDYTPWQYYANSEAECMRLFGIPATSGVPRYQRDDEVHCTSEYSKLTPLEGGEIHTSLVNRRPGVEKPSLELQKFTKARYVRLRLISPRTLNADLMIINRHSHRIDKSVTMRYFYSISDISIGGQCICYGHAESCPSDPVTGQFKCECRHNTCGESCNRCCPLFNQLPWKAGTNSHPNICQQCQCFNHADSCVYDEELDLNKWSITPEGVYEGGGRCIDCKHNTVGYNCERCQDSFYRPSGLSHYREDACRPCDCDPIGSVSDVCIKDDQSAINGQQPGDCVCKPGFGGRRCERCARGYRNYPNCEPCPCNQAGSLNYDQCEEANCQCKANVEGVYCDRCKEGTIHLSASNPQGCQPCFCFGMTKNCTQVDWLKSVVSNNIGWNLTDLTGGKDIRPETENGEVLLFNANQNRDRSLYYWKAPDSFSGNMLNSYGGNLLYYVYYVPQDQGNPVPVADLIIEGNGIKLEYYSRMEFFPRENMTVQIPIREGSGWYNSASRTSVDKADMMRALADVQKFMVRAMYQQNQLQSSIFGLALDTAVPQPEEMDDEDEENVLVPPVVDLSMRGVEVCSCPPDFVGNSCESCAPGFRRVNNQLYGGRCEKCDCNGHSDKCDPHTGKCLECQHNTAGPRCELCLSGYYGNPSLGGEMGMCLPCECPSLENNRSPECMMTQLVVSGAAASKEDDYVCTACEKGYEGNKCEVCADGFFGDPMSENGTCVDCACNGNIDVMAIGNCDTVSGKCLKCIGNTAGDHCEVCKENHWGNALDHTCKSCGCHHIGSIIQQCSLENGDCECKENYIGKHCDRCMDGFGDVENDCPKCNCDLVGSIGSECDAVSGQCDCKQGVFGKHCGQCRPSYFNLTIEGCQFCHCNIYGSIEDGKCDTVTGKCECRENVAGKMCEKCEDGFFNISSGEGCQACDCDVTGSLSSACNIVSGQCECKAGVSGLKCDKCLANHYGMDEEGCKECEPCPAPGQVCDSDTGECICPQNTIGDMCEECADDSWNYHPLNGCLKCDCSSIGSNDAGSCDTATGQCACKEGYVGLKCDRCTHGFFNFPNCEPCNCNENGTDTTQCNDGLCLCDDSGQCPCKKNVEGMKCDTCKEHTFSIDASNLLGCTECFCFNRSTSCMQSELYWQQVYAEDRRAVFEEPWDFYTKKHSLNVLKSHPLRLNSYPTDATPVYWQLPETMTGDRTSSYNGFLRFKIINEDNRRGLLGVRPEQQYFRYFPQVVLVGNNRIELEHIPTEIKEDGKYKIRLHETEWRMRHAPELSLTRKTMMIALQNLQGIYVRGTYNYPARGDAINIKEISLDVGVSKSEAASDSLAIGVEKCVSCPQGYSGQSCQNPDEGYCRKRHRDYLNNIDDLTLIGWSEPCQCNGHSTTCHPETCVCTDCLHNTIGDMCELCRNGFIGDAREGGSAACTQCACPLIENSFSDSCVAVTYGRGYVCNACRKGYTGQYCENCQTGYFGNPEIPAGFCEECNCHPDGSLNSNCDPLTGQCECRPGVTGRDCSRCQDRHAFIGGVCTSCDQGCYLPLMLLIDDLEETLSKQNFSNLKPIPWKRVARIGNNTELISEFVKSLSSSSGGSESDVQHIVADSKYAKEAFSVIEEARFQMERMEKSALSIGQFTGLAEKAILDAQVAYANAFNITQFLKHFHTYGGSSVGGATLDSWALESEAHYNATLDRGLYIEKRLNRAQAEHQKNEELLKKVFSKKLNDTVFENLTNRLQEFGQWLEEFRITIHDTSRKDTQEAERMTNLVSKRIDRYKEVSNEIEKHRAEAEDVLANAKDGTEMAKSDLMQGMISDVQHINLTLERANESADKCSNLTLLYAQLIDEYDEQYVQKSSEHATHLAHEGKRLKDQFKGTQAEAANPLRASQAYEDIVAALRNASHASAKALKAANDAHSEDVESETSQLKQVQAASEQSKTLSVEADSLKKEWTNEEFEKQREKLNDRLASVHDYNIDMIKRNDGIRGQWNKFDDHHDRMAGLQSVARDADKKAENIRKTAEELKQEVRQINDETAKLENSTRQGIQEELIKLRDARTHLEKQTNVLGRVGGLSSANRQRADEMEKQLSLLKERINEARERAQEIRLSLSSSEVSTCHRKYVSPAHPSPANKISIKYRPQRVVPDSAVLVTKTKHRRTVASEYIAVEIRDKRVVVHWNVGAGKKMATNKHPINYIPSTDRSSWYHIDVMRFGNAINLTVSVQETIGLEPSRARKDAVSVLVGESNSSGDVIFNTVPGQTLLEAGVEQSDASDIGLATHKFFGTIGEINVDDVSVPLWTFESSSTTCSGDIPPPQSQNRGHMFRDGFALVNINVQERTLSSYAVIFNAYSPNGLLYFRGSTESGDFAAIYLEDGYVVFKVHLGGESTAIIRSRNSYNDGKQHTVKAIRNQDEVHLQVDSDADRSSSTLPGENTALNINNEDHFVAGIPAGFNVSKFGQHNIQWRSFFGCIHSVKLAGVVELDLRSPVRSHRRQPGCLFTDEERLQPTDRLVGFSKPGYLLTQGVIMDNNSTFGFSFRTKEENATLVFQSSKLSDNRRKQRDATNDGKGFMAFYLFRGYLVLHFGKDASSRKDVVTIRSSQVYNDGQVHSVFMSRIERIIRLRVDDKEVGDGQQLEDQSSIGNSNSQMFLGGLSDRSKPSNGEIPSTIPLIGCISDMVHDYKPRSFIPEDHEAEIGICAMESYHFYPFDDPIDGEAPKGLRKDSRIAHQLDREYYDVHSTLSSQNITRSTSETPLCPGTISQFSYDEERAARFGLSKSSHSRINFEAGNYPNMTSFSISMSVRTEQENGMLWVWANYKTYSRYIYLNVIDGFAVLEVKGHKQPKTIRALERKIDDGHWHDIVITKNDRQISIIIDDLPPEVMTDAPAPKVMKRRMYIGGVISKHRRLFDLTIPGFDGCIRDLRFNGVPQSLDATSRDVRTGV